MHSAFVVSLFIQDLLGLQGVVRGYLVLCGLPFFQELSGVQFLWLPCSCRSCWEFSFAVFLAELLVSACCSCSTVLGGQECIVPEFWEKLSM